MSLSFSTRIARLTTAMKPVPQGHVTRLIGMNVEVEGLDLAVGDTVTLLKSSGPLMAEVVGLQGERTVCVPYGETTGLRSGDAAYSEGKPFTVPVGHALLGRVIDGLGNPIDNGPPLTHLARVSICHTVPNPLRRQRITRQLPLGVRALDTLVPCGRGQRIGIFAGSGVGKSSLLSMIARGTDAEVSVIGLVGERGREVREFIENDLGEEGLARSIVVVATSDEPAMIRHRAAFTATRIAEWHREQGADVLLMVDSVTRFAMAQREIGLAAGEPPATRGYPPSVFGLLPRLLERAGTDEQGSITGIYTVLVEGDDMNEPVADTVRSILDGHIVLSRELAAAGHFPTIDVLASASRLTKAVTSPEQQSHAIAFRRLLAAYKETKDLIEIGAYAEGANPLVDRAVARKSVMDTFLRQDLAEICPAETAWQALHTVVNT